MQTLYQVTYVQKDGLRTLMGAAQGRLMHHSREAAEEFLVALLQNNAEDRLVSVFGEQARGTFRVDAFECYDHGDPVSIYVD